mgnify:CR=1 FL=1
MRGNYQNPVILQFRWKTWTNKVDPSTDHSPYNYEAIVEQSKIVIDTRNACDNIKSEEVSRFNPFNIVTK